MDENIIKLLNSVKYHIESFTGSINNDGAAKNIDEITNKCVKLDNLRAIGQRVSAIHESLQLVINKQQGSIDNDIKQFEDSISRARKAISGTSVVVEQVPQPKIWADIARSSIPEKSTVLEDPFSNMLTDEFSGGFTKDNVVRDNSVRDNSLSLISPKNREVAPGVYLNAYTINHPRECHQYKGFLCWSVVYNRFYLSVNNEIIEATTAPIYSSEQKPYKCLEHRDCEKYGKCKEDYRTTDYYVPPRCNPESKDIRHFTNRMSYVGAAQQLRKKDIYVYRLGNRPSLKEDLHHITEKDYYMFSDLTGNFLLSLVAATKEMRKRKENR